MAGDNGGAAPPAVWALRVPSAAGSVLHTAVAGRLTIGRGKADLVLADAGVSREHAAMSFEGESLTIVDLGSRLGTTVDGQAVGSRPHRLYGGERIRIAAHELVVLRHAGSVLFGGDEPTLRIGSPGRPAVTARLRPLTRVGRDRSGCDVVIEDPTISRVHAEIELAAGGVVLRDLASSNGTRVNGRPIAGAVPVKAGDRIQLGRSETTLEIAPGTPHAPLLQCAVRREGTDRPWAVEIEATAGTSVGRVAAELAAYLGCDEPEGNGTSRSWGLYRESDGHVPHPATAFAFADLARGDDLVLADMPEVTVPPVEATPATGGPRVAVSQLPRQVRFPPAHTFDPPRSPDSLSLKGRGVFWQVVAGSAALFASVAIAIIRPQFAVFALIGGTTALVAISASLLGEQSRRRHSVEVFRGRLVTLDQELERVTAEQRQALRALWPDPSELERWVTRQESRLWERRRGDDDTLVLRLGTGRVPSLVREQGRGSWDGAYEAELDAVLDRHRTLGDAPVRTPPPAHGALGLAGPRGQVDALAAWLVVQAAILHSPHDLRVTVLAVTDEWLWARWLPHAEGTSGVRVAGSRADAARVAGDVVEELDAVSATNPQQPAGPLHLVLVTQGASAVPAVADLVHRGRLKDGLLVTLADDTTSLPPGLATTVALDSEGRAEVRGMYDGAPVDVFEADGMELGAAARVVRRLGRFTDVRSTTAAEGGVEGLIELLGLGPPEQADIERAWRATPEPLLSASVGVGDAGDTIRLGFRTDGPHGMVAGTTGSGKSEFLQSLLAALAATHPPHLLNLFLIDFKGGATFAAVSGLPHVVGLVTDIEQDLSLADRAFTALEAEIERRKRVLDEARVTDIIGYERLPAASTAPMPNLVVVIDEFALLVRQRPDARERLDIVATQGRSLGVHLLLATQSPTGVISQAIRTNTNLWVCLRVVDDGESMEILGRKDAAKVGPDQPGRAFIRRGASDSITPFQVARIARPVATGAPTAGVSIRPFADGEPPGRRTAVSLRPSGRTVTELEVLCRRIAAEAERTGAARGDQLWLPPLPADLPSGSLPRVDATPDRLVTTVGLTDDPRRRRQYPWEVDLTAAGNLLFVGTRGTGKTTALRQVVGDAARRQRPADLHVYCVDAGAGSLAPLKVLPHVGDVVGVNDGERLDRLFLRLEALEARRRDEVALSGASSFSAWRRQAGAPWVVLVVDDYPAFKEVAEQTTAGALNDRLQSLAQSGPAVGIHVVLSASQGGDLRFLFANLFSARVLLRQADTTDYQLLDLRIPSGQAPNLAPGRALVTGALQVQIGQPDDEHLAGVARAHAPDGGPPPVTRLPTEVAWSAVRAAAGASGGGFVLGVAAPENQPLSWDPGRGEPHLLVAGESRSGKSTAVVTFARAAVAAGRAGPIVVVAPRPSPLGALGGEPGVAMVATDRATTAEALEFLSSPAADGGLLLVDDAESLAGSAEALDGILRHARERDIVSCIAGRTSDLSRLFDGWVRYLLSQRTGLLLMPHGDAGFLFETRLPQTQVPMVPGRGYLVERQAVTLVQLALPDSPGEAVPD